MGVVDWILVLFECRSQFLGIAISGIEDRGSRRGGFDLNVKSTLTGHAKFMGYMGLVQMGYGAMTYSTHINNEEAHFLENTYIGQILFSFILCIIFCTRYYLC